MNRIDHAGLDYDDLVLAFGEPGQGDPSKTLAEWDLKTPHGWAEVYDYKAYEAKGDPRKVEEWHVQAASDEAFDWVYAQVESARRAKKAEGGIAPRIPIP